MMWQLEYITWSLSMIFTSCDSFSMTRYISSGFTINHWHCHFIYFMLYYVRGKLCFFAGYIYHIYYSHSDTVYWVTL